LSRGVDFAALLIKLKAVQQLRGALPEASFPIADKSLLVSRLLNPQR